MVTTAAGLLFCFYVAAVALVMAAAKVAGVATIAVV